MFDWIQPNRQLTAKSTWKTLKNIWHLLKDDITAIATVGLSRGKLQPVINHVYISYSWLIVVTKCYLSKFY